MKLILLLFFISSFSFSQNIMVNYKQTYNYDFEDNRLIELFIDVKKNSSVQITNFQYQKYNSYDKIESSNTVSSSLGRKVDYDYLFLNLEDKSLKMYQDLLKKFYDIQDVFPEVKWNLLADKKKIDGIEVFKALGTYRGKEWEVWYAPSIPHSFGPWKLNGLPGLILSAVDKEKNNSFIVEKISYNASCKFCEVPKEKIDGQISMKDFLLLKDDSFNNKAKFFSRDVIIESSKFYFLDLETEFEFPIEFSWETKK